MYIEIIYSLPLTGGVALYVVDVVDYMGSNSALGDRILVWYINCFISTLEVFVVDSGTGFSCAGSFLPYESVAFYLWRFLCVMCFSQSYYVRFIAVHFCLQLQKVCVKASDI